MSRKRLGILVGGGDCPGLNPVLRAVVRAASHEEIDVIAVRDGWRGLIEGDLEPLTRMSVTGILPRGGVILGTSRCNPLQPDSLNRIRDCWQKFGLSALIVVGGNGTLSCAMRMWQEYQYPIVGVPATIDNDIPHTDYSLGFSTAVSVATDAIDRLHTTAESRRQVVVTEVMGGQTGWIATFAGLAGGADVSLIPERPFRISRVCQLLAQRERMGFPFSLVVVAESAMPHPDEDFLTPEQRQLMHREKRVAGIGIFVARQIEEASGLSTRVSVLGPMLMGGSPNAYDRILGTRFGLCAVGMVARGEFGRMVALRGEHITSVLLEEIADRVRPVDESFYRDAEIFFG